MNSFLKVKKSILKKEENVLPWKTPEKRLWKNLSIWTLLSVHFLHYIKSCLATDIQGLRFVKVIKYSTYDIRDI